MNEDALLAWLTRQTRRLADSGAAHPRVVDLALCALILAVSYYTLDTNDWLGPRTVIIGVALCAPLVLRREHPQFSFGAVVAVALLQWLISTPQLADAAVLITLFYVADRGRPLHIAGAAIIVEAGAIMATARWIVADPVEIWIGLTGVTLGAAGLGLAARQRRELLRSLRGRADRLERERDQQAELAAAAERARIAREMHDIVSHNLTVMVALADGAAYAMSAAPEQTEPALERISTTGREALAEMRRLLGVLRDDPEPGPLAPQPSLARLDTLIGQVQAAGIPVSVALEGDPAALSEGVQLTVFRVAQEALTNTLKHAIEPSRATLTLRCVPDEQVELEVTDDGRAWTPRSTPTSHGDDLASHGPGSASEAAPTRSRSAGRGLPGMRERAAAYGGQLEAGPRHEGGWRVALRIDT